MPPPAAATGRKKLSPVIIAALVAALVIVALLIVWILTRGSGTEPTVAPTTPVETTTSAPAESESPTDEASPTFEESPSPDPDSVFGSDAPDPLDPNASATGPLTVDQAAALVDWSRFATGTQERVDSAAASGNCAELQTLRETASANDATVQAATGLGTADLVAYIDAQERAVGCTVSPVP
jgi:cytoskeletal protein RodZ